MPLSSNIFSTSKFIQNVAKPVWFPRLSHTFPNYTQSHILTASFHSSLQLPQKSQKQLKIPKRRLWALPHPFKGRTRATISRRWNSIKPYIRWLPRRKTPRFSALLHKPWSRLSVSHKKIKAMSGFYTTNSDQVGTKAKAVFASFKSKANTYVNTLATKNANNSYGREISRLISAGSVASTNGPPGSNLVQQQLPPSDDEVLMVYPSYCLQRNDGIYEVDVRGWLYLPGQPNRKSKMVLATAKRIAGVKSGGFVRPRPRTAETPSSTALPTSRPNSQDNLISLSDEEDEDLKNLAKEYNDTPQNPPPSYRHDSMSSTVSSMPMHTQEETLNARLAPFLTRPVAFRDITITFSNLMDESGQKMKTFSAQTNSAGRFSIRIELHSKPTVVSVEAHEHLVSFEEVINVEQEGISVISDIDDTIKNTGILGNKRELFRNVFVRDYEKIAIEGVQEWYHELQQMGIKFHYVSNSPWQLYPTISEYLRSSRLPRGSMHLKEYSGFLNGLFEPASEKKRMNLNGILKDFPRRKFILIGDSGEGDLEAYIDIARRYPSQILAIYIRDVTMPPGDKTDLLRTDYSTRSASESASSLLNLPPQDTPIPPPPPKSRAFSVPLVQPVPYPTRATNTNSAPTGASGRVPPPIPPKPLRLTVTKPQEVAPPLPPRPSAMSSNNIYSPRDRSAFTPPPPPSRGASRSTLSQNSSRAASPAPPVFNNSSITPTIVSSSQDDYEFNDILDKRVETWKTRIIAAQNALEGKISFRTWRVGADVRQDSVRVILGKPR